MVFGHEKECDPVLAPCRYCIAGAKLRTMLRPRQLAQVAGIVADLTAGRNVQKHSAEITKRATRFMKQAKAASPKKRGRPRKAGESLKVLKIRGKAVGAVMAKYPTFESLEGASKTELKKLDGVGDGIIATLERAMRKRGMKLAD